MKLSVIIPVYNQENLLIRALESIPVREDIEIIVIDDHSTDNTWDNLVNYSIANIEKRIIPLFNKENQGVGYSRNKGIEHAAGEYILFLDSDDYLYNKLADFINELNGEDIVYYSLEENDNTILTPTEWNKEILCGTVKAIRKDFIGNIRYPNKNFAEDYDFNMELLGKNPKRKYTGILLLHYNHPREGSLFDIAINKKE